MALRGGRLGAFELPGFMNTTTLGSEEKSSRLSANSRDIQRDIRMKSGRSAENPDRIRSPLRERNLGGPSIVSAAAPSEFAAFEIATDLSRDVLLLKKSTRAIQ